MLFYIMLLTIFISMNSKRGNSESIVLKQYLTRLDCDCDECDHDCDNVMNVTVISVIVWLWWVWLTIIINLIFHDYCGLQ